MEVSMKPNRFILLAAIVICASLLILLRHGVADESAAPIGINSPFKSDYVVVTGNRYGTAFGGYLKTAHIHKIGNRDFLVGSAVRFDHRGPVDGKTVWLALEDITTIHEYDSADEMNPAKDVMQDLKRENRTKGTGNETRESAGK
jgi:hypothetical protein